METQPHRTGLFKFKDYCPLVFRHLRQKFGIDPGDYMVWISSSYLSILIYYYLPALCHFHTLGFSL